MFYASTGGNANAIGRTGKLLFLASHYAELDNFLSLLILLVDY